MLRRKQIRCLFFVGGGSARRVGAEGRILLMRSIPDVWGERAVRDIHCKDAETRRTEEMPFRHEAQIISYLKLANKRPGLLGFKRFVNRFPHRSGSTGLNEGCENGGVQNRYASILCGPQRLSVLAVNNPDCDLTYAGGDGGSPGLPSILVDIEARGISLRRRKDADARKEPFGQTR